MRMKLKQACTSMENAMPKIKKLGLHHCLVPHKVGVDRRRKFQEKD